MKETLSAEKDKRMSTEMIHIALPSDQNYVHGLKVTAASIAVYALPETRLHFHILDGGIDDKTFAGFEELIKKWHPHSAFTRHSVDERVFEKCPVWSTNKMTYARLLLPALLPEVDRVVYSDTDVLWLAPVEDLWHLADDGSVAVAGRDGFESTRDSENAWYAKKGYPRPDEDYFCAGIMVFNLREFRRQKITEQVLDFIHKNPDLKFADQTALNYLLFQRVRLISKQWHTLTMELSSGPLQKPVVLHYANEIPWNRSSRWGLLSDTVMMWHWFNDRFILQQPGASLRAYYSPASRIFKRALFLLLTTAPLRACFYAFLKLVNRGALISSFTPYLHRLSRGSLTSLKKEWGRFIRRSLGGTAA